MSPYTLIEEYAGNDAYAAIPVDNGKSLIIFLKPYTPYIDTGILIDAYYQRSNLTYHETNEIIDKLNIHGYHAARRHNYFLKSAAVKSGLCGGGFFNTLTYNSAYGSFFNIGSIIIDGEFEKTVSVRQPVCIRCGRCIAACPAGAISTDGYNRALCLRQLMEKGAVEDDVTAAAFKNRLFGCDICQRVCPVNNFTPVEMPDNLVAAIDALFCSDLVPVSKIIGSNYAKSNLVNLAILTAGNLGLSGYRARIETLSENAAYKINAVRALKSLC